MLYLDVPAYGYADGRRPFLAAVRDARNAAAIYGPRDGHGGRYIAADPFGHWSVVRDPWWPIYGRPHYITADGYAYAADELEPCQDCGRYVAWTDDAGWFHVDTAAACWLNPTRDDDHDGGPCDYASLADELERVHAAGRYVTTADVWRAVNRHGGADENAYPSACDIAYWLNRDHTSR